MSIVCNAHLLDDGHLVLLGVRHFVRVVYQELLDLHRQAVEAATDFSASKSNVTLISSHPCLEPSSQNLLRAVIKAGKVVFHNFKLWNFFHKNQWGT